MEDKTGDAPDTERGREPSVEDFEKLLELAEDLQKERDRERKALDSSTQRTLIVVCILALLAAGFLYVFSTDSVLPPWTQAAYVALFFASVATAGIVLAREFGRRRSVLRDLRASERALYETVGLLRETEHAFSDDWSVLQKARFRIRLSRFAIGPDDAWHEPQIKRKA